MINDLYTATGSWATGQTNQMDYVQIPSIPSADLVSKKLSDNYLMGWIEYDKIPGFCKIGHPVNDGKNFHVDYITENIGWGFCGLTGDTYFNVAVKSDGAAMCGTNNYYCRFLNSGTMAAANYNMLDSTTLSMFITAIAEPTEYADENKIFDASDSGTKFYYTASLTPTIAWSDVVNAVENGGKITFTINSLFGKNRSFSFNDNDCNEYGLYSVTDSDNEVVLYFHITRFTTLPFYTAYERADTSATDSIGIVPFYQFSVPDDPLSNLNSNIKIMTGMINVDSYGSLRLTYNSGTELFGVYWANFRRFDRFFVGNIPYNVSVDEIFAAYGAHTAFSTSGNTGVVAGKFIFRTLDSNGSFDIATSYKMADLYNNLYMLHKHRDVSQTNAELLTYVGKSIVSLFDETNTPIYERENGSATDPDFMAKLQPWQDPGAQITVNDFKPDDIPEYEPPQPEPSEWGADRYGTVPGMWLSSDGITANFITPWVLRGSQVTNFGQFLWENLFLPDPDDPSVIDGLWKNFKDALGTYWQTGSFDPASTLDFVISLLYYPFDLTSNSTDSTEKKIYFGTGALGLTVSSTYNSRKLNTYHGWLYGGGLDLTDASTKNALKIPDDFRGLANSSACLYIPFCGMYQVNWADIRNSSLGLWYAIDFTTGSCTAYVISSKNGSDTYVLTATGIVGFSVPLSATNANRLISSILGDMASSASSFMDTGQNVATKILSNGMLNRGAGANNDFMDAAENASTLQLAGGPIAGTGLAASNFGLIGGGNAAKELFSKPSIGVPVMSGGSGWNALHCPRTPYLQVRTPQYAPDGGHGHAYGWPAEKQAASVGSLPKPSTRNYYECINVDTSSLSCTHDERVMIKQILENGFYIRQE